MRTLIIRWSLLPLLFSFSFAGFGQAPGGSPYYVSWKRDLPYTVAGAGALFGGYLIEEGTDPILLQNLNRPQVNALDEGAINNRSPSARTFSDILAYGSLVTPVAIIADRESIGEAAKVGLLFTETMVINYGITSLIKGVVRRPRPYLYQMNNPDLVIGAYGRSSFPSAHTSNTAAATFFFGRAFADYHPDSKLRPYVWTMAAIVPAATGYLRIQAGEHFLTDVIAGYALGASVGYLVPTLHKRPLAGNRLVVMPTGAGVYLCYSL